MNVAYPPRCRFRAYRAHTRARQDDRQRGEQLYNGMQELAADPHQTDELRTLARVLMRILIGENNPDLGGLSPELADGVAGLVARLQ